jgi:ATP-dependent Lon protease
MVFPGMIVNLDVGRIRSVNAVGAATDAGKKICLATQREAMTGDPTLQDLFPVGTIAESQAAFKITRAVPCGSWWRVWNAVRLKIWNWSRPKKNTWKVRSGTFAGGHPGKGSRPGRSFASSAD